MRKYCFIRHSHILRNAITHRIKEGNIVKAHIADKLGIDRFNVLNYLSGKNPKALTQFDVLRIAKELKIKVELNVEFL